jgi:hypothetical protein
MAKANTIEERKTVRALVVGYSGAGKTGSLFSLLEAGYTIRMMDMDNNSDSLIELCKKHNPALLEKLDIMSFRDKFRSSQAFGVEVAGQPKAFVNMLGALNKWDDGSVPAEWGPDTILVLDTLTSAGRSALHWAKGMNSDAKDGRQWYAAGGEALKSLLEMLTSPGMKCHILVLSHVDLVEMPDKSIQGFASSIGKALGPQIPKVFPTMIAVEKKGSGDRVKRQITTSPTAVLDLKNPKAFDMLPSYPIETGMADVFKVLLGTK